MAKGKGLSASLKSMGNVKVSSAKKGTSSMTKKTTSKKK